MSIKKLKTGNILKPGIKLHRSNIYYRLFINAKLRVQSIRGFQKSWFVRPGDRNAHLKGEHIRVLNKKVMNLRLNLMDDVVSLRKLMKQKVKFKSSNFMEIRHDLDRRIFKQQKLWDFFFDMLSQRKSIYKPFLRRCDSVVAECYQQVFKRLGMQDPCIQTPPLCYLEKAYSFATLRRGVRLSARSSTPIINPFPVVKIPYDRIASPWTLSSLIHEASHDIHGDIPGLWQETKRNIYKTLRGAHFSKEIARTWSFWHKETLADLLGILFGGPAVVYSLSDMMSRPRRVVMRYRANDSHPTPYLRVLISTYTLKKLGFSEEADSIEKKWKKRYPLFSGHKIPVSLLNSAGKVIPIVVRTLLWTRYRQLRGRRFAELVNYSRKTHRLVIAGSKELSSNRIPEKLSSRLIISAGIYAYMRNPDNGINVRKAIYRALDIARRKNDISINAGKIQKLKKNNIILHRLPRKKVQEYRYSRLLAV